ncbi:hypothetical protein ADS79_28930 [Brevibacillus reuszeri]|uniref:Uncharacterized protein n=1 Tax=Brevibacillus reuszeri TaxID=54915 RepID=A0A0K9YMD7_9BACL|nr:hypothetical protein ADS79_28930 [Brevibacillus reuszeri]
MKKQKTLALGCSGGEGKAENAQVLGPLALGIHWSASWKKRNRVQSSGFTVECQRWTLKGVFLFFHYAWVGVPKTFAFFPFSLLPAFGFLRDFF